jgi:hypothetical protein
VSLSGAKPCNLPGQSGLAALRAVLVCLLSCACLLTPASLPAQKTRDTEKKPKSRNLSWNPPSLDSPIHALASTPPCSLPEVLERAGKRATEMVSNLQNFTAQEEIRYQTTDRLFNLQDFGSEVFEYVVAFGPPEMGLIVEEHRNPIRGSSLTAAATQDTGLPEMALLFLPDMQEDYEMACEGAAQWESSPAWVVRFQQRRDRPRRMFSFRVGASVYPASLKGRAWIASDSGEVVHLETGISDEIPAVKVRRWYLTIDYSPVQFQSRPVSFWLPQSADGYCDFGDHRTIVYHTFSNFMLYSVETGQKTVKPRVP